MSFTRMCVKVATAVSKINRLGVTFLKSLFCEHNNILRKAKNTIFVDHEKCHLIQSEQLYLIGISPLDALKP